ncbi:DapH/DapD/GlmU-related protein [Clostridium butyricum]|nr:DapH/DapD/GlmU-related protein [Clostridium butyricum]MDU0325001.1 DapH/DapD/GlmU-related protein [Clostridium butyricum]
MDDIFERLKSGEAIHMVNVKDYHDIAHKEMDRCRKLCFQINHTFPERNHIQELEKTLFLEKIPQDSYFTPPFQVDYACQMTIGNKVFANHNLTIMSAGGIILEDGVMIGPHASLLTVNHDENDLHIIMCKQIVIKKGAWIGAKAIIMPGVTIGEGAIVGSGAVVTHDVARDTIVGGNPARVISKKIKNKDLC